MLVVIEGCDCTGKSTLARELTQGYSAHYLHSGPPKDHPVHEYIGRIRTYDPATDDLVLDRWHLGELVWPKIFKRQTEYTRAMHQYVEHFLRSRGALLIACDGSTEDVQRRLLERGDNALNVDDVPRALALFQRAYQKTKLPLIPHSIERPVSVDLILQVAGALAAAAAYRLNNDQGEIWRWR